LFETGLNLDLDGAYQFNYSNLPWETLGIYDNLLNIIKYRLDKNPNAKIKLTGTNNNTSEQNNLALSKSRAEAVREYLVNSLKINSNRIDISHQNLPDKPSNPTIADGIQENQRVEISSKNFEILAPVELSQIERKANPPIVQLLPSLNSDLPINDWKIEIFQNGKIIREYQGTDLPGKKQWIVGEEPIPQFESPIQIKYYGRDSIGNKFSIDKELKIAQKTIKKKREEIQNDTIFQRYSLIVFDFDKSELTSNHRLILDQIRNKIKTNSIVSIYGYSDRTGTNEYNKELSNKRIDEIVRYLKPASSAINRYPIGSDEFLFDNNTPQGRSYSRTVKIIISTPIK
jgi:outer membrane protein OmpA-like peptidoglycan-associated protein